MEILPWDFDGIYHFNRVISGMISDENMHFIQVNMPIDRPLITPTDDDRILWRNIISNEEYKEKFYEYYSAFLDEYFDSGYFEEKMSKIYNVIYPYLKDDQNAFHSTEQFVGCFNWLKALMLERRDSIKKQILGDFLDEDKQKVIDLLTNASPTYLKYGK
jgi:hypothetical protein